MHSSRAMVEREFIAVGPAFSEELMQEPWQKGASTDRVDRPCCAGVRAKRGEGPVGTVTKGRSNRVCGLPRFELTAESTTESTELTTEIVRPNRGAQ